uniref:Uncharacterized protein n=1 Tax=Vespula pensylvanica TaxID=30213 RepID=A0A834NSI3_VESPE|nr:hypothetical protein H0235_011465 [Vespula pensylvanica]
MRRGHKGIRVLFDEVYTLRTTSLLSRGGTHTDGNSDIAPLIEPVTNSWIFVTPSPPYFPVPLRSTDV